MTNIHQINANTRVKVKQTTFQRIAEYQQKEDEEWITKCKRPYQLDIRVNPISDIIRVAQQMGF